MHKQDLEFIELAIEVGSHSPSHTKVGAVIVGQDNEVIATATNTYPPEDLPAEVGDINGEDAQKYWVEHSERAAIFKAASQGVNLSGTRIFSTFFPCSSCMRAIIQSGIAELICPEPDFNDKLWGYDLYQSKLIMEKSGTKYQAIEIDQQAHKLA